MTNIMILLFLLIAAVALVYIAYKRRTNSKDTFLIPVPLFIILAMLSASLSIKLFLLLFLTIIVFSVLSNKGDKVKLLKILGTTGIIIILFIFIGIYNSNRMPIMSKASKPYIMDVNDAKTSRDTTIKLKKAFLDLNTINATYSVRGHEKVVAIEAKHSPDDTKTLGQCTGLWVGSRLIPESSSIGFSYNSNDFIDPIYLVFYLSDGSNVSFEIKDKVHARDAVKVVSINKKIDYNGSYMEIIKFSKGLNYSSIGFKANFNPRRDTFEVKLIVDGSEIGIGSSGWSGGGSEYQGSFNFDPVNGDNVKLKVLNRELNKEDVIDIDLK